MNYLFSNIINSDRRNPEIEKEYKKIAVNAFPHCFFPFVISFLLREHQTEGSLPRLAPHSNTAGFSFVNLQQDKLRPLSDGHKCKCVSLNGNDAV